MIEKWKIGDVKTNPNNPRTIKDDKFKKLVKSIKDFPEMLELRPIVVNSEGIVLGGNMRLKACKEAGLKEVPVIRAENLTEEQQKEFIIKDNVGFGEWDWEDLNNNWNAEELTEWGLDLPVMMEEPSLDELLGEQRNNPPVMKITFETPEQLQKAEIDIQELLDRKYPNCYFSVSVGEL
jgi:ParB-like chromosome segregation protein Spo0J